MVAVVRRARKTREVGHAGTLDPMATGALVLAIGEATKLVPYLTDAAKEYEARIALGSETDTLDAMGKVVAEREIDRELRAALGAATQPLPPAIQTAVDAEIARTSQTPPRYSAIHTDGERAYAKARRGETVVLEARPVRVHELVVTAMSSEEAFLEVTVKADKGYYVRSLARDLAHGLGTLGHLTALRRIDSGGFSIASALPLHSPREALAERIISLPEAARRALPALVLTDEGVREARFGRRVPFELLASGEARDVPSAWFDQAGVLVAIGVWEENGGRVLRGFHPPEG